MRKFFLFSIVIIICYAASLSLYAKEISEKKTICIKNSLFSIIMPEETRGTFSVKKTRNSISIYHKDSQKSGFGGFAFGVRAYKSPADHAFLPGGRKIGELSGKSFWTRTNTLYDMVLKYPTDVQYDYTGGGVNKGVNKGVNYGVNQGENNVVNPPDSYRLLYDLGENIDIKGVNGLTYRKNQGMKGEDLYKNILAKHITAINEKWDSNKLEKEDLSYMYNVLSKSVKNVLDKVGYCYYDVNADGIEELLIGEIAEGAWKGIVYDMYTMVNRTPRHVVSGGSRNRYFVCDNTFVCNEYSNGANESGMSVYNLVENSTELFPQVSFKYDGYENPKKPYFISYSENWENVSEQTFNERKRTFDTYERFDYIPLSKILEK